VVISDTTPDVIKDQVSLGLGDLFDGLVIAWRKDILLLSDDLPIHQVAADLGFRKTAWTLGVLFTHAGPLPPGYGIASPGAFTMLGSLAAKVQAGTASGRCDSGTSSLW
jgi:hypothetical protein